SALGGPAARWGKSCAAQYPLADVFPMRLDLEAGRHGQYRGAAIKPRQEALLAPGIRLPDARNLRHVLDQPTEPRKECEIGDVRHEHRSKTRDRMLRKAGARPAQGLPVGADGPDQKRLRAVAPGRMAQRRRPGMMRLEAEALEEAKRPGRNPPHPPVKPLRPRGARQRVAEQRIVRLACELLELPLQGCESFLHRRLQ